MKGRAEATGNRRDVAARHRTIAKLSTRWRPSVATRGQHGGNELPAYFDQADAHGTDRIDREESAS
jgi:hypothetical protein